MTTTSAAPTAELDQRVSLHGISWADYERLLAMRGERSVPRITFLQGVVELVANSKSHERIKKTWARLLEAWAKEHQVPLNGFGSWTVKDPRAEAGLEADEYYDVGDEDKRRPDLDLEVVWTSGGLNKLEAYRRLGVPEVWFWRRGRIEVHVLRRRRYQPSDRSVLLPDLDLVQLGSFLGRRDQPQAVREYRRALRRPGQ